MSSWNSSVPPCSGDKENWDGVICQNGTVWGLKLENMGLSGAIDVESLNDLPGLRTISLMNNNFEGTIPALNKLGELKTVYLSNNKFSGNIEANAFEGMHSLKKVHLENNQFTGPIPSSLTTLPKLMELSLDGNQFEGQIPDFKLGVLRFLNVSNNRLQGPIPASFSQMNASSFSGLSQFSHPILINDTEINHRTSPYFVPYDMKLRKVHHESRIFQAFLSEFDNVHRFALTQIIMYLICD